jgi:hypothetical protein
MKKVTIKATTLAGQIALIFAGLGVFLVWIMAILASLAIPILVVILLIKLIFT